MSVVTRFTNDFLIWTEFRSFFGGLKARKIICFLYKRMIGKFLLPSLATVTSDTHLRSFVFHAHEGRAPHLSAPLDIVKGVTCTAVNLIFAIQTKDFR